MLLKLMWVALGGACGAMSRFVVSEAMKSWLGDHFPWGTLTVNMLGSLCMGFLFALVHKHILTSEPARFFLMVGFLGSFTTFSSFALDNVQLMREQSVASMLWNVGGQNIIGVVLVMIGIAIGSRLPT